MKTQLITLLLATFFCLPARTAFCDDTANAGQLPGSYKMTAADNKVEIPFEIYRGDIRFICEVNGQQVHMLLDDGFMWDQLLFWGSPAVDSLGLVYDGEIGIGDEGGDQLVSRTASGITVGFPAVEFLDQAAVVTPYSSGNAGMWFGSVGQISATFFKHFVVDINFERMIITLIKPDEFAYRGQGVAVPWQPLGFGPWSIPATLSLEDGRSVSMKLLMDLGYNDQLQVVVGGEHAVSMPEAKLPASLGMNIQRVETRGFIGRLPQIDIGGYKLPDLLVSFVSREHSDHAVYEGMIGLGLLSRFNLVFDYHGQQLFIEPTERFASPFEYNMTGFEMSAPNLESATVEQVYESSPATEAGLQVGDKVLRINSKPVSEYDRFELRSMLRQAAAEIELLIERNGNRQEVTVVLRRVI
ncbi:MAG: PDZ domain-containing protein [candidate division Zixibacteria bacterium]|nr:PDZ domain-containing protein [candidate division Zixibacteria bacterium]MDH3936987.1 PDZ domain-containing protein [candidate division Zixibacteria bacterium]MDH4033382.1 PDZ domain-containing protein [candidate division Zixibacteria bacterium]